MKLVHFASLTRAQLVMHALNKLEMLFVSSCNAIDAITCIQMKMLALTYECMSVMPSRTPSY